MLQSLTWCCLDMFHIMVVMMPLGFDGGRWIHLLTIAFVIHFGRTAACTVAFRQVTSRFAVTLSPHGCPASHLHISFNIQNNKDIKKAFITDVMFRITQPYSSHYLHIFCNFLWMWYAFRLCICYEGCSNETYLTIFGLLKEELTDQRSGYGKDVNITMVQWLQQQSRNFFADRIHQLLHQWDAWLNTHGKYFKSLLHYPAQSSDRFILNNPFTCIIQMLL